MVAREDAEVSQAVEEDITRVNAFRFAKSMITYKSAWTVPRKIARWKALIYG